MTELSVALAMHVLPVYNPRARWKKSRRRINGKLQQKHSRSVLFYKHEAYRNEQEYRFLQLHRGDVPAPDVKFRSRPYSLVRYREFDWKSVAAEAFHEGKVAITRSQMHKGILSVIGILVALVLGIMKLLLG
jgi:hypothetical protein